MARTITGGDTLVATITSAITLIASDDPLLITTGAEGAMGIIQDAAFGIYGDDSQAWSITNEGTIKATAGIGVTLKGAGIITNGSATYTGATIYGSGTGILAGSATYACVGGTSVFYFTDPSTITNDGTITGAANDGIRLTTGGNVTNGTGSNTAAFIIGGANGVYIGIASYGYANGPGTVTNQGTIRGNSNDGVRLGFGGAVTNTGTAASIYGNDNGVNARHEATVTNEGTIHGHHQNGVYLKLGGTVTNSGTAAYVYGHYTGVDIEHDPNAVVTNQGIIGSGDQDGVILRQGGTFTNSGTASQVNGGYGGVRSFGGYSALTVINEGYILGRNGIGVRADSGGSVTNGSSTNTTALIRGDYAGIHVYGAAATITNDGTVIGERTVSSSFGAGFAGGTLTNGSPANTAAQIYGYGSGIIAGLTFPFGSTFGDAVIVNDGTVIGAYKSAVQMRMSGTVTNGSAGNTLARITGGQNGIYASANASITVTNGGTITGVSAFGIRMLAGGSVTNGDTTNSTALISGNFDAIRISAAAGNVANYGTLLNAGGAGNGVYLHDGGNILNLGSVALISGSDSGVRTNVAGTILNEGHIVARNPAGTAIFAVGGGSINNSGTVVGGRGVAAEAASTIVNAGTAALILATSVGVTVRNGAANVTNQGIIRATATFAAGIALNSGGTIANQGTAAVIDAGYQGIFITGDSAISNDGIIVGHASAAVASRQGNATLTNGGPGNTSAVIQGYDTGAYFTNGKAAVTNFGTITGGVIGLLVDSHQSKIVNNGLINGTNFFGVDLDGGGRLTNAGTITGGLGVTSGTGSTTLTNTGTIIGTSGTAVLLGASNDRVIITSGAVFTGTVNPGGGADVLALNRGGSNTFTGLGSTFIGFETVAVTNPAAKLKLSGANALQDNVTLNLTGNLTVTAGSLNVLGQLNLAATGSLGVTATGAIEIGTTGSLTPGKIVVASDGVLRGHGTLKGAIVDNGLISITGGTLTALNSLSGTGVVALRAGSALVAHGPVFVANLVFSAAGTDETLVADKSVTSRISGFADHDSIDLTGFLAIPALSSFSANHLTLDNGTGGHATLNFAPGYSLADFDIAPDGSGGTSIVHHT